MLLLLLNYIVLRALWKIDVHLISTLVNKSLYYLSLTIMETMTNHLVWVVTSLHRTLMRLSTMISLCQVSWFINIFKLSDW